MQTDKLPDCKNWKLWLGEEVEGKKLGQKTLFVREATKEQILEAFNKHQPKRIWFCKENLPPTMWGIVPVQELRWVAQLAEIFLAAGCEVAMELAMEQTIQAVTYCKECNLNIEFFIKIPLGIELPQNSYVCVGAAFSDTILFYGDGQKMTPDKYFNDIPLIT